MSKKDLVLRIDQSRNYVSGPVNTVYYLNDSNAFFAELSAITADMGTLNAGSIVIGDANKLWLNDDDDGGLAIGGEIKESAPFRVDEAGHVVMTSVDITAGNGVIINEDGIRVGGAGASALVINEIKEIVGGMPVGKGIHALRFYDVVGIPAISMLTQKDGTNSPLFRLGRTMDADWLQWDASGLALSGTITAKDGLIGGWTIALDNLYAGSGVSRVGMAPGTWPFYAGDNSPGNAPFRVSLNGLLVATNAIINGTISAAAGSIGGWTIDTGHLYSGAGIDRAGMLPGIYPFYAGSETVGLAPFRVTPYGVLTASDAHITGEINASSGSISGDLVVSGALQVSGSLQIGTGTSHVLIDGANALLKSSGYAPGSMGWQINNAGDAEFNNLTARGSIKTVVFEKSLITTVAGSWGCWKSASALYAPCDIAVPVTTVRVRPQAGGAPFETDDIVRLKNETLDVWGTILAGAEYDGFWEYFVVWQYGSTSGTFPIGHAVVDYGQAGQGYFIVSADGLLGASAAWALRSHDGAPWLSETTHVYAGTDGRLYAGGGYVKLDSNGIGIEYSSEGSDPQSILWTENGDERGRIVCYGCGESDASLAVLSKNISLNGSNIRIQGGTGFNDGKISLYTNTVINDGGGTFEDFRVESVNEEHILFVDSSEDALSLGGSTSKIGLYGVTPVIRATTAGSAATFVQNSGTAINDASTFDGYTLKQVVKALRNCGALT